MEISFENVSNIQQDKLYKKMDEESFKMLKYIREEFNKFPKLFDINYESMEEVEKYLKSISLPNKYVCAKQIKSLPGWTCRECVRYTDSIFCHECYKKSKHLHNSKYLF